ncbi:hypothetical protein ACKWTF_013175 [Chironomus riparius]
MMCIQLTDYLAILYLMFQFVYECLKMFMISFFPHYGMIGNIYIMSSTFPDLAFTPIEQVRFKEIIYDRRDAYNGHIKPKFDLVSQDQFIKFKPFNDSIKWILKELKTTENLGSLLITSENGLPCVILRSVVNFPRLTINTFLTSLGPIAERWRVLSMSQLNQNEFDVIFQVDANGYDTVLRQNWIPFGHNKIEIHLERIVKPRIITCGGLSIEEPNQFFYAAFFMTILLGISTFGLMAVF